MRVEADRRRVVDFDTWPGGDMVCADEVPRSPHTRGWIEVAMRPHGRSEKAKQQAAPGVQRARRRAEEQKPDSVPKGAACAVCETEGGAVERVRVRHSGDVVGGAIVRLRHRLASPANCI